MWSVNCILAIPSFGANIHLSVSAYHVCSFVSGFGAFIWEGSPGGAVSGWSFLRLCSTRCISSHGYFDSHSKNALQELGNFIRSYLFILELTELAISVLFRKFPVYFGLEVLYILNLHRQFCHTLLWYLLYLRFCLFSLIYFVGDVYICNS